MGVGHCWPKIGQDTCIHEAVYGFSEPIISTEPELFSV